MSVLLPNNYNTDIETVTTIILHKLKPEKIFLLGCTTTRKHTKTIFTKQTISPVESLLSLFVLVLTDQNTNCNEAQDKIENLCRNIVPVTALVFTMEQFNEWCQQQHRFAQTVITRAQLLYDDPSTEIPALAFTDRPKKQMQADYTHGLNKVQEFLAGADLYRIRKQNNFAVFMLHQAAEQALLTILKLTIGIRVVTHNLDKLLRFCSFATANIMEVFPRNNDKNERLFKLLNKAYCETRYQNDYSITAGDLIVLTERVRALQQVMKEVADAYKQQANEKTI